MGTNFLRSILAVFLLSGFTLPALAQRSMPDCIPQDAVLVVRATGLRAAWDKLVASALWQRVEQAPIPDIANGIRSARQGIAQFEAQAGVNVRDSLTALGGRDIAFVLFPDATYAFLSESDDIPGVRKALEIIASIEQDQGKRIGQQTEDYAGAQLTDVRLVDAQNPQWPERHRYEAILGNVLVVGPNRAAVLRVLDSAAGAKPSLRASPEFIEAAALERPQATLRIFADIDKLAKMEGLDTFLNAKTPHPATRAVAEHLREHLKSTRFAMADVAFDKGAADVRIVTAWDPAEWRKRLANLRPMNSHLSVPSLSALSFVPESAVFVHAWQVNKGLLWGYILETVRRSDPATAEQMSRRAPQIARMIGGMSAEKLLACLGDQTALFAMPGTPERPPALVLAQELNLNEGWEIPQALPTLIGSLVTIGEIEAERAGRPPTLALARAQHNGIELTTLRLLDPKLAGMLNPTVAMSPPFLLIATDPKAIGDATDAAARRANGKPGDLDDGRTGAKGYLDVTGARALLQRHRAFLVAQGVKDGKTPQKAEQDTAGVEFVLSLIRRVEWSRVHHDGTVERMLRITAAE